MEAQDRSGPGRDGDPARMLSIAESERSRTSVLLEPDGAVLYGSWGLAWLIGAGLMWLAAEHALLPFGLAGGIFGVLLVAAGVVTAVHSGRRSAGIAGPSRRIGAMYGWSWFLGFGALVAIMWAAGSSGASEDLLRLLWPALSCLVVGLLYLAAGALWQDTTQYAIGAWVLIVGTLGALLGAPTNLLVMSVTGGGVFLAAAAASRLRRRT